MGENQQVLLLPFLAPDVVAKIVVGRQLAELSMDRPSRARWRELWPDQREWIAGLAG